MEKKNSSGLLVGILLGLVIALIIGGCLFATGNISFKTNTTTDKEQLESKNKDVSSYIGEYIYKEEDSIPYTAIIDLMDNGTFYARETATSGVYYYGTYEINGNKLVLTNLFHTPNVAGMANKINNVTTYTITEDGKITTAVKDREELSFPTNNVKAITLIKNSNECTIEKDFIDTLTKMYIGLQEEIN